MSTTPVIDTQLVSEVAALKALVSRLLNLAEGAADQSQTIPEFCSAERISRAFYYEMRKAGRGPREMRHADGCVRVSPRRVSTGAAIASARLKAQNTKDV